jgi:hypothetical protein
MTAYNSKKHIRNVAFINFKSKVIISKVFISKVFISKVFISKVFISKVFKSKVFISSVVVSKKISVMRPYKEECLSWKALVRKRER